jgi:uncharacterized glyoxalase superfamily protein PhnB
MLMNRTMPPCSVMPELVYEDVDVAIEWLCGAFGFVERWRAPGHRAQLRVGDGAIVVRERREGKHAAGVDVDGHSMMVRVEDLAAHLQRSRVHGAAILAPPMDYPYGERQYSALDLDGHRWTFTESIADVAPEQWGGVSASLA